MFLYMFEYDIKKDRIVKEKADYLGICKGCSIPGVNISEKIKNLCNFFHSAIYDFIPDNEEKKTGIIFSKGESQLIFNFLHD